VIPVKLIASAITIGSGGSAGREGPAAQISAGQLLAFSPVVLVAIPAAKILATSLSVGSGDSCGIFGPGMVIGGMLGAVLWRAGNGVLPGMPHEPTPFVIIGMVSLFAAGAWRRDFVTRFIAAVSLPLASEGGCDGARRFFSRKALRRDRLGAGRLRG
jgi:H+/Cl- antiporter ClcA